MTHFKLVDEGEEHKSRDFSSITYNRSTTYNKYSIYIVNIVVILFKTGKIFRTQQCP